jgi:glycosyltransferase involved in cell wall biosynthesis
MLAILATHPIQYQVPLWQALAQDQQVPFEVWYCSRHGTVESRDREFGKNFSWDLDMLSGYGHRFLKTPAGATPNTPLRLRVSESLPKLFWATQVQAVWVQGWQVAAYWEAVWAAKRAGLQLWLRGESNNLAPEPPQPKRAFKRLLLGQLFQRVDHFLCIGSANRSLYQSYGVPESKLHMTPYAVDNERFRQQAEKLKSQRAKIRKQWGIAEDAYCALFCGKFIRKKRPMDLIKAAQLLIADKRKPNVHLLFVGSGELDDHMRAACNVIFDAESAGKRASAIDSSRPNATFTGFLNQTEISKAYLAADLLVLPSNFAETWGLVVNEAMASGLRCLISDQCGCSADLGNVVGNAVFPCGDIPALVEGIMQLVPECLPVSTPPSFDQTVHTVRRLYRGS